MDESAQTAHRWGSNTRQSDQQSGRASILNAAIRCYLDRGVSATTIDDIAAEAKISRRTIYRYFSGKQAVIEALVEQQAIAFFDQLWRAVRRYRKDFPTLLQRCMLYTIENGPRAPGHGLMMDRADNIAAASHHYFASETIREAWAELLRDSFETAIATGSIAADTDFEQLIAWSRRLVLSYILFPAPLQSVKRDIDRFVLRALTSDGPLATSATQ